MQMASKKAERLAPAGAGPWLRRYGPWLRRYGPWLRRYGPWLRRYGPWLRRYGPWLRRYGPWVIVTGASDGIGREVAVEAARRGAHVVIAARRRDALEQLADELKGRFDVDVVVVATDLGTSDGCRRLLDATEALDVGLLVASAGFGTSGPFLDGDLAVELDMLAVNCGAVAALGHGVGRRLIGRGRGGLILLSSIVAFQGVPRAAHYAATKAYVQSLAEGLAVELRPHGVDVLSTAPGPVESGFANRANMQMGATVSPAAVAHATLDALGRRTTVRPGWLSKVLEAGLSMLPRSWRVRMMTRVMAGMTRHQRTAPA